MLSSISANDLKVKGISAIEAQLSDGMPEAMITVRGNVKYVVMPIEAYNQYREMELQMALEEAKQAVQNGDYYQESVKAHIKRVTK